MEWRGKKGSTLRCCDVVDGRSRSVHMWRILVRKRASEATSLPDPALSEDDWQSSCSRRGRPPPRRRRVPCCSRRGRSSWVRTWCGTRRRRCC
ncbi:hypothetical protein MBM_05707 [Drepanopeziza brunnea f. sp. 'multigermtubi' MB_m1]|uniref:Uncharacterized protein n=1 Tax=Marssonina brunnea f. sp. multigermtubi (strain MB_m1) TaxID=1072389 RepID=K1X6X8_MARBU|nr:uncharacterized protein MBM_05707 [Drepanopeziza brunnea f. sp. 'multigermtubi' MB_m1]EKD16413.1 hypothetical protein MBM_05707 [Drepanopeziza brunnea f. sp. 'multigermtubi' MB_m1]